MYWPSIAVLLCVACAACGGSPTAPDSKSAGLTTISLTGNGPVSGTTSQFTAHASYANGTREDVTTSATWRSSDTAVATVSANGVVTGVRAGSATISASLHAVTGSVGVTVATDGTPPTGNSTPPRSCVSGLSPEQIAIPAGGGSGIVTVSASSGCTWHIVNESSFVTLTSGSSGTGDGRIAYTVDANAGGARHATLEVSAPGGDVYLAFAQEQGQRPPQGSCAFSVYPLVLDFGNPAGSRTVTVTMTQGTSCPWTATTDGDFVSFAKGANGVGSGQLTVSVTQNSTPAFRNATISVAGYSIRVIQNIPYCVTALSPQSLAVAGNGGTATVKVTTLIPNCSWVATGYPSWITFAGVPWASGNAQLTLQVAPNPGAPRQATFPVSGVNNDQMLTVTQERGDPITCTFEVSAAAIAASAAGGAYTLAVTAPSGCSWSASNYPSWITVTGEPSGTGNGQLRLQVAVNGGPARQATFTVGQGGSSDRAVTVTQERGDRADCTYSVSPTSFSAPSYGGSYAFTVSTNSGCLWTASAQASWLYFGTGTPSPAQSISGSGTGQVMVLVPLNGSGNLRAATFTLAGQTMTVTQQASCIASLSSGGDVTVPAGGAIGTVSVTTYNGTCSWRVASNDSFVTITSGASGVGPGQFSYSVAANPGAQRQARITVVDESSDDSRAIFITQLQALLELAMTAAFSQM